MFGRQLLLAVAVSLVSFAEADLPRLPNSAHNAILHHGARAKREWDGWQTFPEKCKEQCKPYIEIRNNCGARVDATLLEDGSDKLDCTCTTAYFDAVIACVRCAPEPFREAIGESPKEWVESALDICIATGKEMECVDTSSLSTEGATASADSDGTDAQQDTKEKQQSDQPEEDTAKIEEPGSSVSSPPSEPSSSTVTGESISNSSMTPAATSDPTSMNNSTANDDDSARETPLPASEEEEGDLVELNVGSASAGTSRMQLVLAQTVLAVIWLGLMSSW